MAAKWGFAIGDLDADEYSPGDDIEITYVVHGARKTVTKTVHGVRTDYPHWDVRIWMDDGSELRRRDDTVGFRDPPASTQPVKSHSMID